MWGWAKKKFRQARDFVLGVVNNVTSALGWWLHFVWVRWWQVIWYLIWLGPEKKLRLHVVILSDRNGPLANEADVQSAVNLTIRVFKSEANVKSSAISIPQTPSFRLRPRQHLSLLWSRHVTGAGLVKP